MKKMMLIMLALMGLGMANQLDAHNGYSHKKKTTTHAQKRKHAAYRLRQRNAQEIAVASPAPAPEVEEAVPARSRTRLSNNFSIKKALLFLMLLSVQNVCLLSGREEQRSLVQGRIDSMWPGIAQRIGLSVDFPITVGDRSVYRYGYSDADRDLLNIVGLDEYAEVKLAKFENPWCPEPSISIEAHTDAQASDGALAWVIGHEATHAKYDCARLSVVEFSLRGLRKEFWYSFGCSVLPPEVNIIEEFEMQRYLPGLRSMKKDEIEGLHLKKAGNLGFAISRLKEFRADRIGCEVAGISNCGQSALEILGAASRGLESCDATHPNTYDRVAALDKKKPTPLLRGGVARLHQLAKALDTTGRYSDEEILVVAEKALKIVQKLIIK